MRKPKQKKPSQSEQFDLNEVPSEPRTPLVMFLNFIAIAGGFIAVALFTAHMVGMVQVESALIMSCIQTALLFGAIGQALSYLGHMREIAEWRAERELLRHPYRED